MWRGLGVSYEYGVLDNAARTAIHMTHRLGAVAVLLSVGWLSLRSLRFAADNRVRIAGAVVGGLMLVQIGLGVANAWFYLPISTAVGHNACAALLILALITLGHGLRSAGK